MSRLASHIAQDAGVAEAHASNDGTSCARSISLPVALCRVSGIFSRLKKTPIQPAVSATGPALNPPLNFAIVGAGHCCAAFG